MHNLSNEYFQSEFNTNEYGNELSPEFEFNSENIGESQYELSPEFTFESQGYEMNEGELIQELMGVTNESEFGSWLKNLGKKAVGIASGFLGSPTGQQATALLGNIAKRTLPGLGSRAGGWVGGRLGGIVGQSNYGRKIGQRFGSQAGQSAADYYPDFVKFASDALSNMSQEYEAGIQPQVKPAIVGAAKKYYPIILKVKGTLQARQVQNTNEMEFNNEFAGETYGEANYEMQGEITSNEGTLSEVTEMELASELLSIQSEAELDKFFGGLFKKKF